MQEKLTYDKSSYRLQLPYSEMEEALFAVGYVAFGSARSRGEDEKYENYVAAYLGHMFAEHEAYLQDENTYASTDKQTVSYIKLAGVARRVILLTILPREKNERFNDEYITAACSALDEVDQAFDTYCGLTFDPRLPI